LFTTKKHIKEIINALNKMLDGDFEQKISVYSKGEIAKLANTINETINKLKEKIRQQEQENSQIQTILNSMMEGVIALDKEKRIISINPAVSKIFNIAKENAEGRFLLEAIRNADIFEVIEDVLKSGKSISKELNLLWPVKRIFKVSVSPIFENKAINGCVAVIYDITEIRKLEAIRSEFVANVSHELKTPLTSIKGFVETLLEGALTDKENSRTFLEIIKEHSERLEVIINDLLELSHIESKEIKLEMEKINMSNLTGEIIKEFKSQLNKKNISVHNKLSAEVEAKVDKEKIRRILMNLIDNAIKFNKEGGHINIYGEIFDKEIRIIIEDSGIGIPQKDIGRIFERFYRVDKARSRQLGGSGLGLSIVKHLVELHGGGVGVESTEGAGSKFWFNLPKP
jgi:two-component system phosphate regulon sensor histidine kinase PhoR